MNYHTHLHHHHVVSMRKLKDHDKKVNITIQKEKKVSNKLKHDYDDSYFV
jgi:hypothetical protein